MNDMFSNDVLTIALEEFQNILENEKEYWQKKYNCIVYNNQIEILNTFCNPLNHYINIIQARGAGKSFACALAILEQSLKIANLKTMIVAPKAQQAKRLIGEIYEIISKCSTEISKEVNSNSSSMLISFNNGSKIYAVSGAKEAQTEGEHPNCFDGQTTFINIDKRKIKLQNIVENKININVRCYNEGTGKLEYKPIIGWHKNKRQNKKMLKISYEINKKIKEIICTEDHLIYTKNRGWVKAIELDLKKDIIFNENNGYKSHIKKIEILENYKEEYVYDISVKDNHNYIANDILVHNCIVIDEAHLVSSHTWSSKISPMLGSHGYYQIVKIGVAMGKGHFNESFNNKNYKNIVCDWVHADRLKQSGIFTYTNKDGITLDYPKYVVEALMPPGAKKKWFPDRPDLITGSGGVSELDWLMQFEIQWLDDISLYLKEEEQKKLASGSHKLLTMPLPNGTYIFGLDTASGRPNMETMGLDYTALSIFDIRAGKMLKVFSRTWQGDPIVQYDEILDILKKFKVKYGMVDFSSLAYMLVSMLQKDGIKCEGIQYHATCSESHKDWKTTIFDNFMARLNLGQVYYPLMEDEDYKDFKGNIEMMNNLEATRDAFYQWCILQRIQSKKSSKVLIGAPNKENDDACLSGNTLIPLADGRTLTMEELSKIDLSQIYTYSLNIENMLIQPGKVKRVWKKGNKKVIKLMFDNGKYLECTEDHLIMMRDGTYKQAKDLNVQDSLMPLYRRITKASKKYSGYELIKCLKTNKYVATHKLFIFGEKNNDNRVIHHCDYNKRNNNLENLKIMTSEEHILLHNNDFWKKMTPEERTARCKKGWEKYPTKESRIERMKNWVKGAKEWKKNNPEKAFLIHKETMKKIWSNPKRHEDQSKALKENWSKLSKEERIEKMMPVIKMGAQARKGAGSWCKGLTKETDERIKNASKKLSETRLQKIASGEIIIKKLPLKIEICPICKLKTIIICKGLCQKCYSKQYWELHKEEQNKKRRNKEYNHKIIEIIDENKYIDVYDMEIEGYHNFAIDSGIFVHNCNADALSVYACQRANAQFNVSNMVIGIASHGTTFFSK